MAPRSRTPIGIVCRYRFQPKRSRSVPTCTVSSRVLCCANCVKHYSPTAKCRKHFECGVRANGTQRGANWKGGTCMEADHAAKLEALLGDPSRIIRQKEIVEQLSRDFFWYSPVLRKQLDGKTGDFVVQPLSATEIQEILRYCYVHNLAVTIRGA